MSERERVSERGARAATKEHRSVGSGLGQGKRSLIARGVAGEGEKLFSVCRHSRVYSDYQKVRVVPGLQLPKVSVSVPLSEVMAKSITSACARAVVCPSKRSLFFSCVLVRRNSSFVSVEVPRRKARVDAGVAATTVRNQSTCQSSFILESALGPVDVPNTTLPNYIWRDFEEWSDKPAVVSKNSQISCDWSGGLGCHGYNNVIWTSWSTILGYCTCLRRAHFVTFLIMISL